MMHVRTITRGSELERDAWNIVTPQGTDLDIKQILRVVRNRRRKWFDLKLYQPRKANASRNKERLNGYICYITSFNRTVFKSTTIASAKIADNK